jgi:hypothetical protein
MGGNQVTGLDNSNTARADVLKPEAGGDIERSIPVRYE